MTVRKKEIRQLLRIRLVMASASWLRTQNSIQFLSSFSRPMTHKSFMFSMANLGMYHTGGRHVELRHVIGRGTCLPTPLAVKGPAAMPCWHHRPASASIRGRRLVLLPPPRRWAPIGYSPATQNQPAPALSDLHNVKTNFVVAAGFRVSFELRPASAS